MLLEKKKVIIMNYQEQIKQLRLEKGYSQSQMAQMLNVSRSTVAKWETGKAIPSAEDLLLLKRHFDISIDAILDDNAENVNEPYDVAKWRNSSIVKILLLGLAFALTFASILFYISDILKAKGNYVEVPMLTILWMFSDLAIIICIVVWIACLLRKNGDIKGACSTVIIYYFCEIVRSLVGYFFIGNLELSTATMNIYEVLRYVVIPLLCSMSMVLFYKRDDYVNPGIVILIYITRVLDGTIGWSKSIYHNRTRLLFFDYNFAAGLLRWLNIVIIFSLFLYYALVLSRERKEKKQCLKISGGQ